uniref:XPG-I domain-containing protein n=1 Tax=Callorhinchus milii TaxID=7868 RepID=A0A4W3GJZ5_CALMI
FIDLCILLGCDYCETIRGIGPKRAIELIRQHRCIEEVLKHIDGNKYTVPGDWAYSQARSLFLTPDVVNVDDVELKWTEPEEDKLVSFLCEDKGFRSVRGVEGECER